MFKVELSDSYRDAVIQASETIFTGKNFEYTVTLLVGTWFNRDAELANQPM